MSASAEHTAIFMTDTPNQIKNKVRAVTGGPSRVKTRAHLHYHPQSRWVRAAIDQQIRLLGRAGHHREAPPAGWQHRGRRRVPVPELLPGGRRGARAHPRSVHQGRDAHGRAKEAMHRGHPAVHRRVPKGAAPTDRKFGQMDRGSPWPGTFCSPLTLCSGAHKSPTRWQKSS